MSVDPLERLARANPVPIPPVVESPERLRGLIGADRGHASLVKRRFARGCFRRGALAGLPLTAAASVAAVLLVLGSSSPAVNVAAAAYAATAPRAGIVEIDSLIHIYRGSEAGTVLRQQEWIDAALDRQREVDTATALDGRGGGARINDWSFTPGSLEQWSNGPGAGGVHRYVGAYSTHYADHPGFDINGIAIDGVDGIAFFRALYRDGQVRVDGRERRDGQVLWRLESHPEPRGIDRHTRLIVLVDPRTFMPLFERQVDLQAPGHPAMVDSELQSYRTVPATPANERIFDLSAQHPGTTLYTLSKPGPPGRFTRRR
jgi:hypothetical protein